MEGPSKSGATCGLYLATLKVCLSSRDGALIEKMGGKVVAFVEDVSAVFAFAPSQAGTPLDFHTHFSCACRFSVHSLNRLK